MHHSWRSSRALKRPRSTSCPMSLPVSMSIGCIQSPLLICQAGLLIAGSGLIQAMPIGCFGPIATTAQTLTF